MKKINLKGGEYDDGSAQYAMDCPLYLDFNRSGQFQA